MIASLGAAKLQEEFGGQVGVDVVSVKSTGRDNEGAALAVGKYLNPRVLLSYAQALDAESDSFVSLEYFLRGRFKLESTFGQRGQTSLGIGWSKDY
jgi:autotransporter translocation and assembly factor TamB